MSMEKRMELALQLREIEFQDENRKRLIQLCVLRALSLNTSKQGITNGSIDTGANDINTKSPPKPAKASKTPSEFLRVEVNTDLETLQKKMQTYEVQVASLKMQLSTKEQAYEAKVDELKDEIETLRAEQKVLNGNLSTKSKGKTHLGRKKGSLISRSPINRPTRPVSSFFANSPFSDSKTGKGNSFSGDGIASIASQASLKLSKKPSKATDDVFSPNNSSAESTPKKSKSQSGIPDSAAGEKTTESETEKTPSVNLSVSDPEETFQSANATFDAEKGKKPKKRKIRLISSEASKLILASQEQVHTNETEDLNSVNYYQDDNFEKDSGLPVVSQPGPTATEPVVKKRHVFKIGEDF